MGSEYAKTARPRDKAAALEAARSALAEARKSFYAVGVWADTYRADAEEVFGLSAGEADPSVYEYEPFAAALDVLAAARETVLRMEQHVARMESFE